MTDKPTRRDLMRPAQLLAVAFGAALFGGLITAMSMGAFQAIPLEDVLHAWSVGGIVAGASFIAVLLIVSMLLLVVDPNTQGGTVDEPLLVKKDAERAAKKSSGH
ncbi:amino acid transporter [Microbacterium stercoris]|nr:amino acid transporter [Microbacterium stercoris]